MARRSDNSKDPRIQRNIVFFGETGTGKSSAINLLLETDAPAPVSNDSRPCTQASTSYETTLNGTKYRLWDTRGLGEARNFLRAIFGGGSEKELKKFLKERHRNREIDLLVYCVRGSRATEASVKHYNNFCIITRRLVAPVVLLVTYLEREKDMEDWWNRNSFDLKERGMEFDDHVCITARPEDLRLAESKRKLADLITRERRWETKESGNYFGSPVQRFTPSKPVSPPKGGIRSLFKVMGRGNIAGEGLNRRSRGYSVPSSPTSSTTDSSYHPVDSPVESTLPSLVVEPPTPRSATTSTKVPHIDTDLLGVGDRPQSSSDESPESSLRSMFHTSSHSSHTLHEVYLESCTGEQEDYLSELPFKHSTATVRRRQNYAIRNGAFGDIWDCDLISGESSRMVAVKAVKTNTNSHEDLEYHDKKRRRELKVWGRLQHKNVVPLLGVVSGFGPLPSTVSPWFHNGSLSSYLANRQTSRSEKHRLLGDIAVGLCYLHDQEVIHGDLHSGNVLIDDHGTACLTDFGLSVISEFVGTSYLKSSICGGVQFADPALVQRIDRSPDDVFYPTKACDVYSFGGIMLHVLSGKKPYDGIPSTIVFLTVLRGEQPQIPSRDKYITRWHTSLMRKCWDHEEDRRPSAHDLVRKFDRQ